MADIPSHYSEFLETVIEKPSPTESISHNRIPWFVLVGLNHRSAPVGIRQRVHFSKDVLEEALDGLAREASHGVIVSTCSRTEVYTSSHNPELTVSQIKGFLNRFLDLEESLIDPYLYVRTELDAVRHLFYVAAGLDSAILGEWQILDQVRQSIKAAANRVQAALPTPLYRLFHGAVETGREARLKTGFGETDADIGVAVARCAKDSLGDIENARALIIGAGDVARLSSQALSKAAVSEFVIANRSMDHAQQLAEQLGGIAVRESDIPKYLAQADIVVSATGAPFFTVTKEMVEIARRDSLERPLFIADLAVPADIDPQISAMDHIRLCDIHTIQQSLGENSDESGDAMAAAAAITEDGLDRFNRWFDSLDVAPQIQEMQKRSEQIRKQELNKSLRGLTGVTDEQIAVIDTLTRSIVKKMLHKPITDLKRSAGSYRLHDIRSISSTE